MTKKTLNQNSKYIQELIGNIEKASSLVIIQ